MYVIFYEDDQQKSRTEYLPASSLRFALEQFNQIMQIKSIKKPKIKRITQYEYVATVNYS
jgi:hypothetical protein